MAAESRCPAALDGAHHLHLVETDTAAVGLTPSGTVIAEDIRDLQRWPGHALGRLSGMPPLLGNPVERARHRRSVLVATCA